MTKAIFIEGSFLQQLTSRLLLTRTTERLLNLSKSMEPYLVWIAKVNATLINFILRRNIKDSLKHFYSYDSIPLIVYFNIIDSGNFSLVNARGRGTVEQCMDVWEQIVKYNAEATGSNVYFSWFRTMREYWKLYSKHAVIVASLLLLRVRVDLKTINDLKKYGYKVSMVSSHAYAESLERIAAQARNLQSLIKIKESELKALNDENAVEQAKGESSFDSVIASLSIHTGLNIPDTITLKRYNEMVKIVKERNQNTTANG
jgi:hypothetical protein